MSCRWIAPAALAASVLSLTTPALASPASDFFDRFAALLTENYVSLHGGDPAKAVTDGRAALTAACQGKGDACGIDVAVPVVRQALASLNDSHVRLEDPRAAKGTQAAMAGGAGKQAGFGLNVAAHAGGPHYIVAAVNADGPAGKAGLTYGDQVLAINGNADIKAALGVLSLPDQPATLTIGRAGKRFDVTLTPVEGQAHALPALFWHGKVARITLPYCGVLEAGELFRAKVAEAKQQHAAAIIVDLRNNRGGGLACPIAAGAFVSYQTEFRPASGPGPMFHVSADKVVYGDGEQAQATPVRNAVTYDGPVSVLVNRVTASAAEAMAMQMVLAGRARSYGQKTSGVGNNTLRPFPMEGGYSLVLTVTRNYQPDGTPLPADVPLSVEIPAGDIGSPDNVLAAALSDLNT